MYPRYGSITWPEVWPSVEAANLCNGTVPINKIWHSSNETTEPTGFAIFAVCPWEWNGPSVARRFLLTISIVTWQMLLLLLLRVRILCSCNCYYCWHCTFDHSADPFVCWPCLLATAISHTSSWHVPNLFVQVCLLSSSAAAAILRPRICVCRVPRAIALIAA